MKLSHKFVKSVPEVLENDVIYVSTEYATAIHKCACGCGSEVVTPLSPTDWRLTFDGKSVSLYPSIGNWSQPCQSHYWITASTVEWAPRWDKRQIEKNRKQDAQTKQIYNAKKGSILDRAKLKLKSFFS